MRILLFIFCLSSLLEAGEIREPHLTPEKLVGTRFARSTFEGIEIAILGYCPPPNMDKYEPQNTKDQYFILMPPCCVQICKHKDLKFLSISHIYGCPVSAALLEELHYFGIKYVLAYGLAGSLDGDKLGLFDFYLVEDAFAKDGTTSNYTDETVIASDKKLNRLILELAKSDPILASIKPVRAVVGDAIYREYEEFIEEAKTNGCDIVNLESSSLFAVCNKLGIITTQCGVITDVSQSQSGDWESALSTMLSDSNTNTKNPIDDVGTIVEFYLEKVVPQLLRNE